MSKLSAITQLLEYKIVYYSSAFLFVVFCLPFIFLAFIVYCFFLLWILHTTTGAMKVAEFEKYSTLKHIVLNKLFFKGSQHLTLKYKRQMM